MVEIYFDLIKKNLYTVEQVPMRWREEVQSMLDKDQGEA